MVYAIFAGVDFNVFIDTLSSGAGDKQIETARIYYTVVMQSVQEKIANPGQIQKVFADAQQDFTNAVRGKERKPQEQKENTGAQERNAQRRKEMEEKRRKAAAKKQNANGVDNADNDDLSDKVNEITTNKK